MSRANRYGIYAIINLENKKIYIGSTVKTQGFSRRWASHRYKLKKNIHANNHLQNAWNKYGEDNFEFRIIEECKEDVIIQRENVWIKNYDSLNRNSGYNLKDASQTIISEETNKKISNTMKKKWANGEMSISDDGIKRKRERMSGKNNPMYGVHLNPTIDQIKRTTEHLYKPVKQIDNNGNVINTFKSISEAHSSLNKLPNNSIGLCCRGLKKQAYGFKWKFT